MNKPGTLVREGELQVRYPARLERQEDGRYFVQFIDLEDTFTEGHSVDEALFNASEVLSAMLSWYLDTGKTIPTASAVNDNSYLIAPDAKTQAALLLRQARSHLTLAEMARAMETSWPQAQKLENPHHWPSLKTLDKAAKVLGKRLVLQLV